MPDAELSARSAPPVPGPLSLAWQLLMKPVRLRRCFDAWGWSLGGNPQLFRLFGKREDPTHRRLARSFATLLLVVMPVVVGLSNGAFRLLGVSVNWEAATLGAVLGIVVGFLFGVTSGWVAGAVVGVTWGALGGVVEGPVFGGSLGLASGLVATAGWPRHGFERNLKQTLRHALLAGVAGGVLAGLLWGTIVPGGEARWVGSFHVGWVFALLYAIAFLQIPSYIFGCLIMAVAVLAARSRTGLPRFIAALLPCRAHDLVYFRLPFLFEFLVRVGSRDQVTAKGMIEKLLRLPPQKKVARFALYELQGRELVRAAEQKDFVRVAAPDLTFISSQDEGFEYFFEPFQKAASKILEANEKRKTSLAKLEALNEAEYFLKELQRKLAGTFGRQGRCVLDATHSWVSAAEAEKKSVPPPIPNPFVAGPVLRPEDEGLFRGRSDVISLIRDVVEDQRGTILLFGQRRMGKSSLVRMLPLKIGRGIEIVEINFQRLSTRDEPFNWVAEAVADARPELSSPPRSTDWRRTLSWLREVDEALGEVREHLLVVIDEVEGLTRVFGESRATRDFLDMIRAAGDDLVRVRFLLMTARSLRNLGEQWADRLISAHPRFLGPLKTEEASDLIQSPTPDFPDIYPPAGVARIVEVTHGHPFLVQLVCESLCRRLRDEDKPKATPADVERAIDESYNLAVDVFSEVWRTMGKEEHRVLQSVASGKGVGKNDRDTLQTLRREGYLSMKDDRWVVAVPMFERWVREWFL